MTRDDKISIFEKPYVGVKVFRRSQNCKGTPAHWSWKHLDTCLRQPPHLAYGETEAHRNNDLFQASRLNGTRELTRNQYLWFVAKLALRHRQRLGATCREPEKKVKVISRKKYGKGRVVKNGASRQSRRSKFC